MKNQMPEYYKEKIKFMPPHERTIYELVWNGWDNIKVLPDVFGLYSLYSLFYDELTLNPGTFVQILNKLYNTRMSENGQIRQIDIVNMANINQVESFSILLAQKHVGSGKLKLERTEFIKQLISHFSADPKKETKAKRFFAKIKYYFTKVKSFVKSLFTRS